MSVRACCFSNEQITIVPNVDMASLRATSRLILLTLITGVLFLVFIAGQSVIGLLFPHHARWRNFMVRNWAKLASRIIGIRLHVEGSPPEPPFFLVSNHLSYIDIVLLFRLTDAVFVAKSELKSWPVIGFMARAIGIIFIDRENIRDIPRVNRLISEYITDQQGIILFPEGTSSPGSDVLPFKPSLLRYPAVNKMEVSYASIHYHSNNPDKPAYNHICWWGDMTFADHFFSLLKLDTFDAFITFGNNKIIDQNRKRLAVKLHQVIKDQFKPLYKEREYEKA